MNAADGEVWRVGGAEDVAAIRSLVDAAYAKWVPVIGRPPLPMQADYARAIHTHAFTVVEKDDELIGLIETEARADHLYIVSVAVAPAEQRKGLGRRLIAAAESQARAKGFLHVRLITNALYKPNIALYQQLGYVIERREPLLNGVVVHMGKDLAD